MKLLFDQHLSPKLVRLLADLYPDSEHVMNVGLDRADDEEIWNFAMQNAFSIVTKDADYNNMSVLWGHPPKVIWLLPGNCTTRQIESLFRARYPDLMAFETDTTLGTLALRESPPGIPP